MAVYRRTYQPYQGSLTAHWRRFLVIPTFAWRNVFEQRFLTIFYVVCFFYPLACAVAIYLNSNLGFLAEYIPLPNGPVFEVGGRFFLVYANVQGAFAFLLSAFIGPGLISPDLANGGLPLYFYRPFSRFEYVAGKMTVLVVLLSQITWIPGLFLWFLQAGISQPKWWRANVWLAESIVLTSLLWIVVIVLFALALSAWVKWRIVAGALLLVTFFLTSGLGAAINVILRTTKGSLVDPGANLERVTMWLMRREPPEGLSLEESLASLSVMLLLCLWMLTRKLKANEVVR